MISCYCYDFIIINTIFDDHIWQRYLEIISLEDLKLVFLDRKNCENDGLKKILENKKEFKK